MEPERKLFALSALKSKAGTGNISLSLFFYRIAVNIVFLRRIGKCCLSRNKLSVFQLCVCIRIRNKQQLVSSSHGPFQQNIGTVVRYKVCRRPDIALIWALELPVIIPGNRQAYILKCHFFIIIIFDGNIKLNIVIDKRIFLCYLKIFNSIIQPGFFRILYCDSVICRIQRYDPVIFRIACCRRFLFPVQRIGKFHFSQEFSGAHFHTMGFFIYNKICIIGLIFQLQGFDLSISADRELIDVIFYRPVLGRIADCKNSIQRLAVDIIIAAVSALKRLICNLRQNCARIRAVCINIERMFTDLADNMAAVRLNSQVIPLPRINHGSPFRQNRLLAVCYFSYFKKIIPCRKLIIVVVIFILISEHNGTAFSLFLNLHMSCIIKIRVFFIIYKKTGSGVILQKMVPARQFRAPVVNCRFAYCNEPLAAAPALRLFSCLHCTENISVQRLSLLVSVN